MRKYQARLHVESLEARDLMSVAYTPAQIRHAYGFDQLPLDGSGQTIAIIDGYDDPTIVQDLITFDRSFNLPDPNFLKVNEFGGKALPATGDASAIGEITLDVEWSHAIAPRANILLVEANSMSEQDLFTAVDFARHVSSVSTISMSFGFTPEPSNETLIDSVSTTPAGHTGGAGLPGGITFVASTGDHGAPGGYPAYSPNVLAVGGTSLYLDNQGNYLGEVGWSYGSDSDPTLAGGGGISQLEPEPAYQYSVQNTGARTIPDVAYDADPGTGFVLYETAAGGFTVEGGTSAGAPQWAGLIALADQARAVYLGAGSLDGPTQTLPAIYSPQMSGDFNQVQSGYNGYFAGPGYNLVTGLGTPYAPYVVSDLASVDVAGAAAARPAANSGAAITLNDNPASLLAVNRLASVQLSKSTVDTLFTGFSAPMATTPEVDHAPVSIVVVDQVAMDWASKRESTAVGDVQSVSMGSRKLAQNHDALQQGIEAEIANVHI